MENIFTLNTDELEIYSSLENPIKKILTANSENRLIGSFPLSLYKQLAELGLTALAIPEEHGGTGASASLQAALYRLIAAYNLGPAIFLSVHSMVGGLISRFGNNQLKSDLLSKLASGEHLAAFALSEPEAGSNAAALSTTAELTDNDTFILNGEKCWITSAGAADIYLVFARTPKSESKNGIQAIVVEKNCQGLTIGPSEKKMGCEDSPIGSLYFDNCKVPAKNLIGTFDKGYEVALGGLVGGRINIASCALGLATTALSKSIEHLKTRRQFGKHLREMQGLQFKIADLKMLLDASELLVVRAADSLNKKLSPETCKLQAAIAKCYATDAAMTITTEAVQLHGALGYVSSTGVEKLMRDAKMLQIVEGANEVQRSIIAREVLFS